MAENRGRILSNERVTVVGKTGSGKSFLTTRYLAGYPHVLVIDVKGDFDVRTLGATVLHKPDQIRSIGGKGGRFVFRPRAEDIANRARAVVLWNEVYWTLYRMRNIVVATDEVKAVAGDAGIATDGMNAVIQMGRSRGVGHWSCTQRPSRVPLNTISESEHFFCFTLRRPEDRKLMAELMETPEVAQPIEDEHGFWYFGPRMARATYITKVRTAAA